MVENLKEPYGMKKDPLRHSSEPRKYSAETYIYVLYNPASSDGKMHIHVYITVASKPTKKISVYE